MPSVFPNIHQHVPYVTKLDFIHVSEPWDDISAGTQAQLSNMDFTKAHLNANCRKHPVTYVQITELIY